MKYFVKSFLLILFYKGSNSAPRKPRHSLIEDYAYSHFIQDIDGVPGTYRFGYDIRDSQTGNIQYRGEERYPNGTVLGEYQYVDPSGTTKHYRYVADKEGYRVSEVKYDNYQMTVEPFRPYDQSVESSITWTRPANPKKKKPMNTLLNKMQVHKRPQEFNLTGPPSLYVEY